MSVTVVKNRTDPVVRYGRRRKRTGSLGFETRGEAEFTVLNQMLDSQQVLYLQQPNGECWYFHPGGMDSVILANSSFVQNTDRRITLAVDETSQPPLGAA